MNATTIKPSIVNPTTVNPTTVKTLLLLMFALTLLAGACGSGTESTQTDADPTDTTTDTDQSIAPAERSKRLWIGPRLVDCVGVVPQQCLQVRTSVDGQTEWFYDTIIGFNFVEGTAYVIDVDVTEIADPPADASSLEYRLIEVISQTADADQAATIGLDATSWTLLGFADGQLFDRVAGGTEVTIAFDGDTVSGSGGCNQFGGPLVLDGATISLSETAFQEMGCEGPAGEQEVRFQKILWTATTAEITFDDRLILAPPTGLTLVFARSSS